MPARSAGTCTPCPRTCQRVSSLHLYVARNCNSHPSLDMIMSPCNEGESCKDEYCLYRHPKKAQRAYRFDYLACYHDGRIVAAYKGPSGTLFKQVRYRHYPLRENIQYEPRYLADINRRLDYVIRRMQQLGEGRRLEEAGTPFSPANSATPTPHSTAPPPIHYPRVPNVMAQPFDLARHPPVLRGPIIAPHGGHCYPHAQVQMAASPPPPSPMFKTPGLPTSFVHGPFGHYTPIAPAPAIEHYYGGPGPVYSSPPVMCS
jgi:hypothetical protein